MFLNVCFEVKVFYIYVINKILNILHKVLQPEQLKKKSIENQDQNTT